MDDVRHERPPLNGGNLNSNLFETNAWHVHAPMSKYTTVIFGLRMTFFLDLLLDSYCRAKLLQQIINMFLDFYGAIQMLRVKGISVFCMLTLRLCK